MKKLNSVEELQHLQKDLVGVMKLREMSNFPEQYTQIRVAISPCGLAAGSKEIYDSLFSFVENTNLDIIVSQCDCFGDCANEPSMEIKHIGYDWVRYNNLTSSKAIDIIKLGEA